MSQVTNPSRRKKFYNVDELVTIFREYKKNTPIEQIIPLTGRTFKSLISLRYDYLYFKKTGKVYTSRGKKLLEHFIQADKVVEAESTGQTPAPTANTLFTELDSLMEEFKTKLATIIISTAKNAVIQERDIVYKEGFEAGKNANRKENQSLGDILKNKFGIKEE